MGDPDLMSTGYPVPGLPLEGISATQKYLEAISTKPIQPDAAYTVRFEPVDLWVMDSM